MLRPITKRLINAINLDMVPDAVVCCDFGIDQWNHNPHFGALQWAYKYECFNDVELDEALGNGPALTELVNRISPYNGRTNPYACTFVTLYDNYYDMDDGEEDEEP
jgi:hypothetical protein